MVLLREVAMQKTRAISGCSCLSLTLAQLEIGLILVIFG